MYISPARLEKKNTCYLIQHHIQHIYPKDRTGSFKKIHLACLSKSQNIPSTAKKDV